MHVVQICSLRSVHMQIRDERAAWSPNYRRLRNVGADVRNREERASAIGPDISLSCFPLKCPWCHRNRSEISAHRKAHSPTESRVMCRICIRHFTKSKARERRRRKCVDPYPSSVPRDYSKTAETDGSNSLNVRNSNGTS